MGLRTDRVLGVTTLQQYGTALKHLPQIVARRAFKTTSVAEQKDHAAEAGGHMKRCLVGLSAEPWSFEWALP